MRRALPVLVVLLAVLAVVWCLRPTDVDEEDGGTLEVGEAVSEAPSPLTLPPPDRAEPHLEGRPDARPARPAPRWVTRLVRPTPPVPRFGIHGTVRDEHGRPVHRATVYQLSQKLPRGTNWVRETGETDPEGAFSFLGHPPANTWICARRHGCRTVFAEGGDVATDGSIHLVLETAPPLVARFVDAESSPVWYGSVRAVPITHRGPECTFPGPESAVAEQLETTGPDGTATFRFERAVPVVIVPEVESMLALPSELRVPAAEGTFTFEVFSAGGLELKAVDEGGERVRESLWVSVLDPHTGEELASYRSSEKDGALEVEPSLPPGPYHLDVSARGYEPVLIPDLVLPVGPAVVRRTATMEPLAGSATLWIELPQLPADARVTRGNEQPAVFLLRRDGAWEAVGWTRRAAFGWEPEAARLQLEVRPGTYEVVLCRPQDGTTASLGPLTLGPGDTVKRRARAAPGVTFALYDVLPPDIAVRAVRIVVPGRGRFLPTGSWFSTSIRDAATLVETIDPPGSKERSTPGGGALLGPYPGPSVVLEVDDWSGRTHRLPVGD